MHNRVIEILGQLRAQGVDVGNLCVDSRTLQPGEVFLAYPGQTQDGRRHIAGAIAAGAAAILWERAGFDWNDGWRLPNLPVDGLRTLAGHVAHEVYGRPSEKLWVMGVTGTNGKTSCSQWLAEGCGACGARTAVIGTLGIGFPGALVPNPNTTPEAVTLHRSLDRLLSEGAQGAVMEVSSIGLDQERTNGVRFGAALFTNLSRDHLEYHGDMERYAQAKQILFRSPGLRHAVVNMDDVQGVSIARMLVGSDVIRTGYSCFDGTAKRSGLEQYVEAHDVITSVRGIAFTVRSSWGEARIESRLLGRFNISNLLGVLATMMVSGVPFERASGVLGTLVPVAGRLERVGGGARPLIVVDYAHSPDALDKVAQVLRDLAAAQSGRLCVVFGCGGDRDRGKRPLMGTVASRYADRIFVTSDNPRGEDPDAIIAEIKAGITIAHDAIADRRAAIAAAVAWARAGDVVLIAGKGHETHQESGGEKLPFSDVREAELALDRWAP
ncbi:MAG: UDP-N-acetylmuramoyl-L-alanyl-D-glutamate--2,6-diaminopimelate ligase [Betaproteobacteria bacterium RIFCSPLOWO2_02_FULL_63_19]|nr:MAG: UDP-N-acetylmuramoyl-L-alanyl-D-glutamate--2,6-diaminopimelate ligase [Betaproteobacteria bacterium RIFCSPLOWO2_02_FULL_63_19]